MARMSRKDLARAVLRRYPKSYADTLHINVARNTPAPLYQWLIVSLLFSARISAAQAESAAAALFRQGWRTPQKMNAVTWRQRVDVLNRSGYARYDESTSRYIADTTKLLLERYRGDLRALRAAAEGDPKQERARIKEFKGIGDVGADIFFREAQIAWDELYPFADRKALDVGRRLGLGETAHDLAKLVSRSDLPRLLSGLVRVGLAREIDEISKTAA